MTKYFLRHPFAFCFLCSLVFCFLPIVTVILLLLLDTSLVCDKWWPQVESSSGVAHCSSLISSDLVEPLSGNSSSVINERENVNRVQNSYEPQEVHQQPKIIKEYSPLHKSPLPLYSTSFYNILSHQKIRNMIVKEISRQAWTVIIKSIFNDSFSKYQFLSKNCL